MASTIARVVVASEWHFTEPNDIRTQFTSTRIGSNKNVEYDAKNHQFIVDCPIFESDVVAAELGKLIKTYIERQEELFVTESEILQDVPKIQPIVATTLGTEQDQIWSKVALLEAESQDPDALLIPQVTRYMVSMLGPHDMRQAFSEGTVNDVARAQNCQIDLELTETGDVTNRIRVKGWSEDDVHEAMGSLATVELQYRSRKQKEAFDFVDDEGHLQAKMRFRRPTNVLDVDLFLPGKPPLCELILVEWHPGSRQNVIVRKKQVPLDHSRIQPTLWLKPLQFQFEKEENRPATFHEQPDPDAHGDLSLPQRGRLEQWVDQVSTNPLDPTEANTADEMARPRLRKTIRVPPPKKKEQASGAFAERIKEQSDDELSLPDLEPLQAGFRSNSLLEPNGKQWPCVAIALKNIMAKAKQLHEQSLSFELCFGRVYIYSVSLSDSVKPRLHYGKVPQIFDANTWPNHFRIRSKGHGASTQFSHKLTQSALDAEFLLNLKMKGGEMLFEATPKHRRAYFEILCYDSRTQVEAVIELMESGAATIEGSQENVGTINVHYPARCWDCHWRLSARKQFGDEQQRQIFATVEEHAYVLNDLEGLREPELYFKGHDRVSIRSVKLIRESVHRVPKASPHLVLRQVKILEKQSMGSEMFRAYALDEEVLRERHQVWWEAKLMSAQLNYMLQENRGMKLGKIATWEIDAAEPVLRSMLELAQHVIPKIDNVGYTTDGRLNDGSAEDQDASQSASVARMMSTTNSLANAQIHGR